MIVSFEIISVHAQLLRNSQRENLRARYRSAQGEPCLVRRRLAVAGAVDLFSTIALVLTDEEVVVNVLPF